MTVLPLLSFFSFELLGVDESYFSNNFSALAMDPITVLDFSFLFPEMLVIDGDLDWFLGVVLIPLIKLLSLDLVGVMGLLMGVLDSLGVMGMVLTKVATSLDFPSPRALDSRELRKERRLIYQLKEPCL
jgi:hypothetical protein